MSAPFARGDSGVCGDSHATVLETVFGRALESSAAPTDGNGPMQFTRVVGPVEDLEIWSASSDGLSFVISYQSRSGPSFHGRTGFVASWRPIHQSSRAIKVGGSPFETLTEAEEACKAMLGYLTRKLDGE